MSYCSSREAIFFAYDLIRNTYKVERLFSTIDTLAVITVENNQNAVGDTAFLCRKLQTLCSSHDYS